MSLNEFQKTISEISEKIRARKNVTANDYMSMLHIIEELGEIAREMYNFERKRKEFSKENLGEEFADIIMLLSEFAYRKGINLEEVVNKKIEKLKKRHDLN